MIFTPGADSHHPWVRAFAGAMAALLPTRLREVSLPSPEGLGSMAGVYFQRSGEAGRARRELARDCLRDIPDDWALVQLYTNECMPADLNYYVFTDVLLATMGAYAADIPGYQWPQNLLTEAMDREFQVLECAKLIFVPSRWLFSWSQENLPRHIARKLRIVGWGPGMNLASVGAWRERMGPFGQPKDFTALFVGNDSERKGLSATLAAIGAVRRTIPEARMLLVGPHKVQEHGVRCLGTADIADPQGQRLLTSAYQASSLFVMPSLFEPFGCAFLEAMQAGLPIVARPVCAIPEFVIPGKTGWLADGPDEIASAIIAAASDPAELAQRGRTARELVLSRYGWDRVAAKMIRLFQLEST